MATSLQPCTSAVRESLLRGHPTGFTAGYEDRNWFSPLVARSRPDRDDLVSVELRCSSCSVESLFERWILHRAKLIVRHTTFWNSGWKDARARTHARELACTNTHAHMHAHACTNTLVCTHTHNTHVPVSASAFECHLLVTFSSCTFDWFLTKFQYLPPPPKLPSPPSIPGLLSPL